jgi:hypothetical protein
VAPRFDATMYVSASSLNLREAPDTGGRVLTSLPRNTRVARDAVPAAAFPSPPFGHLSPMGRGSAGAEPAGLCGGAAAECGVVPVAAVLQPDRLMRGSAVVPGQLQLGGRWMAMGMVCRVRRFVGRA